MRKQITVTEIFRLEPELRRITDEAARAVKTSENPWLVYARAKAAADGLVGCLAVKKDLQTPIAYECFINDLAGRMGL